jgi:hypothetical protein
MTHRPLARTVDAVANQRPVIAGLTTDLRRSIGADAPTVIELDGAGDHVVRLLTRVPPTHSADA